MLARNHLSAQELNVTDDELAALVTVRGMMERGEVVHTPVINRNWFDTAAEFENPPPNGFSMAPYIHKSECGTVACFAGWANIVSGGKVFPKDWFSMQSMIDYPTLSDLFVADGCPRTVEQATEGLNNFLLTGDARWDTIGTTDA